MSQQDWSHSLLKHDKADYVIIITGARFRALKKHKTKHFKTPIKVGCNINIDNKYLEIGGFDIVPVFWIYSTELGYCDHNDTLILIIMFSVIKINPVWFNNT